MLKLPKTLKQADDSVEHAFDNFLIIEKRFILKLFEKRREVLILMDKSAGVNYSDAKENLIRLIEKHIKRKAV